ncbi:hypothetical protein BDR06DRAFT_968726 [Suillus hirtellus]|nr:hypothetical protein BDR06DRAFT_968726 [Suillus hirtellus]
MPDLQSGYGPMNGATQLQCSYLAHTTLAVHQNASAVMQINPVRCGEKGNWRESIHPLGATYYYNGKTLKQRTYTEMNLGTCLEAQLQKLESWIDASRSKIDGKQWLLVIDPMLVRGEEIYPYYYVVLESQIITWVELMDGYILFQECTAGSNSKLNTGNTLNTFHMRQQCMSQK